MATPPQNSAYTMSTMSVQAPAFNPMFADSNAPPPPPAPIAIDVATVPLQPAALPQNQEPVSSGPWTSQAPVYGSYGLPPPPLHSAPPAYAMAPFVPEFRPAQAPQPRAARGIESTHPRDKGFVCAIYRSQKQCPVSNCPYAHIQDGTTKPLPLTPCNFFQTSRCLRDGCAFFHGLATTLSAVRASGVTTYCPLDYMPTRDPLSELSEAELQLTAGQVCARSSGMVLPGSSQNTASSTASALRPPPAAPTPMWPPPPFYYPTPPGPANPHHPAYPPNPYVVSSTAVNVPPNAMLPSPYPPPPMYSGHTHHHQHQHQHQHQQQHHHHHHQHHQHHYGGGSVPAPAYNYYPTAPPPFPPSA